MVTKNSLEIEEQGQPLLVIEPGPTRQLSAQSLGSCLLCHVKQLSSSIKSRATVSSCRISPCQAVLLFLFLCSFGVALAIFAPQHSVASCLASSQVEFLDQSSLAWDKRITPWNLRVTYTPALVAIPRSIDQVQSAVSCGINGSMRVTAKGGGHSYGSFGLGGEDGHLVIDLDRMTSIIVDHDNVATIQPGARLGSVALELFRQGQRAIAHGSCPG